jgi:oxaloacetate decarboxylase
MSHIAHATSLSLMVDADHGYGNALTVMRTVEDLEAAWVSALTVELSSWSASLLSESASRAF